MKVGLIDHMGDDLMVVNAARVSFDKESSWEWNCDQNMARVPEWSPYATFRVLSDRDAKLISYLARHGHWSPFAHPQIQLRIKAPIFVARQLAKHQVGLVWNEVSRRYVDDEPEFYEPEAWRARAENVKQGSSAAEIYDYGTTIAGERLITIPEVEHGEIINHALKVYREMMVAGVCPEQARMVLPQSMMTEWIWTGSLLAFSRVCQLRLDSHSQAETREIAEKIAEIIEPLFPVSWRNLMENEQSTTT